MFIAMVSTTTYYYKEQVVYNTSESSWLFFIYWELGLSPLVVLLLRNLIWKKKIYEKNPVPRTPSSHRPAWSPRITRGGPRGRKLCSDTLPGGSKRRYKSFEYSTTTTTTQLTPTTNTQLTSSIPESAVLWPSRSRPAFESRFRTYIHYHAAAAMLIARFHISTNHKIEFYYDRERHITREVV